MTTRATEPRGGGIKATFNWVTQAGSSVLRNLPFGGAVGVVASGVVLWLAPHVVPAGWSAEAVLSLGMGAGVVLSRLVDGLFGWFVEPARRHLGARWEAWLRLGKLDGYRKRGLLAEKDVKELAVRIVKDDVSPKKASKR